jgi:hypothetical protein
MLCNKCSKGTGLLVLIFGIIFLLQNLGIWAFWNIQWYTVLFVLAGLSMICMGGCPMCKECCGESCCKADATPGSKAEPEAKAEEKVAVKAAEAKASAKKK